MTDLRLFTALVLILVLSACSSLTPSFYRLDVRQGNVLESTQVEQLQPGMSRRQVQALLGSPAIIDPFRANRWDYLYMFYPAGDVQRGQRRHLTVYFEDEVVVRVEDSEQQP